VYVSGRISQHKRLNVAAHMLARGDLNCTSSKHITLSVFARINLHKRLKMSQSVPAGRICTSLKKKEKEKGKHDLRVQDQSAPVIKCMTVYMCRLKLHINAKNSTTSVCRISSTRAKNMSMFAR
jgi:hypothetical protein